MKILELNAPRGQPTFDFTRLSDVLFESADLLEEARQSTDIEFKAAAVELAIRCMYTASTAIDRFGVPQADDLEIPVATPPPMLSPPAWRKPPQSTYS